MSLDLQSLRTAKAALDEGLLNEQDYATIKSSFVRAQSIKAGVDAGFISNEDYAAARTAFFGGLGMIHGGGATPNGDPVVNHRNFPASKPASAPSALQPTVNTVQQTAAPPSPSKPAATPPAARKTPTAVTVPQSAPTPEADAHESTPGGSIAPTPTGLQDRGGAQVVADKVCKSDSFPPHRACSATFESCQVSEAAPVYS
jgi:hypothetical protein